MNTSETCPRHSDGADFTSVRVGIPPPTLRATSARAEDMGGPWPVELHPVRRPAGRSSGPGRGKDNGMVTLVDSPVPIPPRLF
ncbi:hypothetical protein [Lewinella cohaerens]|uniref:hypothetical protein n=1 Tax=Lewinella cohaerens TaxID=70995 RepID=UPI001B7FB938|nr:hypothetical protein [Lewinella cohaerens]